MFYETPLSIPISSAIFILITEVHLFRCRYFVCDFITNSLEFLLNGWRQARHVCIIIFSSFSSFSCAEILLMTVKKQFFSLQLKYEWLVFASGTCFWKTYTATEIYYYWRWNLPYSYCIYSQFYFAQTHRKVVSVPLL